MEHKDVSEALQTARDTITVKRVFGDAIDQDGITVIPAANVSGGGGGGGGEGEDTEGKHGSGSGGGFGVRARPAGVYVIEGERVSWRPAIDVNRIVLGLFALVGVALVTRGAVERARQAAPRRRWHL